MSRKAAKTDNLIDAKLKKTFIEMRDHFATLDERAKSAAGKRRQYSKEIKEAGYSMMQIKISLSLQTPEGEAEFKAEMANRLLAAAYSDADIGDQLSLFLDGDRTPAVDRAYKEGQTCAMKNEAAAPKYDPSTPQYTAFMEGYHEEQGRQVKAGIGKLDAKAGNGKGASNSPKSGKTGKGAKSAAKAAKPAGKRGRSPGSGKGAAPKDDAPPRRPAARPATRASVAAAKAKGDDSAESYFTKAEPQGNA